MIRRAAFIALALGAIHFVAALTGNLPRIARIDRLSSPVAVLGWDETGLALADGRRLPLPDFSRLPPRSEALSEATRRGVEFSADGRINGLVKVHHWCGNDPVREHIARVDLSHLLSFVREGQRVTPLPDSAQLARKVGGQFSERGWRVDEWRAFRLFSKEMAAGQTEQRTGASRSAHETNQPPSAVGSRP